MVIQVHLGIGLANAYRHTKLEIPDEYLEGLTDQQVEDLQYEYAQEWADNHIEIWVEVES